ncbi:MAG: hypothetical protein ACRETD_07765 [Steroidobacteraceae bacterium]
MNVDRRRIVTGLTVASAALPLAACGGGGSDAVEDLMREHGVLRRVLLVYRLCSAKLRSGQSFDTGALNGAAILFQRFGEDYPCPRARRDVRTSARTPPARLPDQRRARQRRRPTSPSLPRRSRNEDLLQGVLLLAAWYRARWFGLVDKDAPEGLDDAFVQRVVRAQALYAVGAALCVFSTWWSIGFIVAVQLNYVIAPRVWPFNRL